MVVYQIDFVIISICMGVSENSGTPKSSILIGFSTINHPFWGIPISGKTLYLHLQGSELLGFFRARAWMQ